MRPCIALAAFLALVPTLAGAQSPPPTPAVPPSDQAVPAEIQRPPTGVLVPPPTGDTAITKPPPAKTPDGKPLISK